VLAGYPPPDPAAASSGRREKVLVGAANR